MSPERPSEPVSCACVTSFVIHFKPDTVSAVLTSDTSRVITSSYKGYQQEINLLRYWIFGCCTILWALDAGIQDTLLYIKILLVATRCFHRSANGKYLAPSLPKPVSTMQQRKLLEVIFR